MAEKKPDEKPVDEQPKDAVAAEQDMHSVDKEMAEEREQHRTFLTEVALEDMPEARESASKMNANIARETEAHEKRMASLNEQRMKALKGLDTEHYYAKPWKGTMRYQCAYCYRDARSEAAIQEHQALDHKRGFGKPVMNRFGEYDPEGKRE